MSEHRGGTVFFLVLAFFVALTVSSAALEPAADFLFDAKREFTMSELAFLPSTEAFGRLKAADFLFSDLALHRALSMAYGHRRSEAVALALTHLDAQPLEMVGGRMVSRLDDFTLAKRILALFPEESVPRLLDLFRRAHPVAKGNILKVAGKMPGGAALESLLREALDDKTFCEKENPESVGEPLRICDVAYNQLVQRHAVKNVLRTIGTAHRIEVRDHHISILKGRL